jgi:hypothetical protein
MYVCMYVCMYVLLHQNVQRSFGIHFKCNRYICLGAEDFLTFTNIGLLEVEIFSQFSGSSNFPVPRSDPIRSDPIRSDPIRSDPIRSDPIRSDPGKRADASLVTLPPVHLESRDGRHRPEEDLRRHLDWGEAHFESGLVAKSKVVKTYTADTGLPDFSCYMIPKPEKCTKVTQNVPNIHKISQISVKYSKWTYNI